MSAESVIHRINAMRYAQGQQPLNARQEHIVNEYILDEPDYKLSSEDSAILRTLLLTNE